jgi:hypothetical protein
MERKRYSRTLTSLRQNARDAVTVTRTLNRYPDWRHRVPAHWDPKPPTPPPGPFFWRMSGRKSRLWTVLKSQAACIVLLSELLGADAADQVQYTWAGRWKPSGWCCYLCFVSDGNVQLQRHVSGCALWLLPAEAGCYCRHLDLERNTEALKRSDPSFDLPESRLLCALDVVGWLVGWFAALHCDCALEYCGEGYLSVCYRNLRSYGSTLDCWNFLYCRTSFVSIIIIIVIPILVITFMHGIYNYIPETQHVTTVFTVCATRNVISPVKYVLYFYISTSCSMCAVHNMAVFAVT